MKLFASILVCLGLLNFCAFMAHCTLIGGSAEHGKVENGKYYVCDHGHYTEVSQATFQLSKWLGMSAVVTFIIAGFIMLDRCLTKDKSGDRKRGDSASRKKRRITQEREQTKEK